jgi:hypothetical protein
MSFQQLQKVCVVNCKKNPLMSSTKKKDESLPEFWTSGVADKTINSCYGSLTINWCNSNHSNPSPWWQGKVEGLVDETVSHAISFKQPHTLKVAAKNASLPFLCKVHFTFP